MSYLSLIRMRCLFDQEERQNGRQRKVRIRRSQHEMTKAELGSKREKTGEEKKVPVDATEWR